MQNLWDNPDLLVIHGSRLFGCDVPGSDVDTRGFVVLPGEYLIGRRKFEQHDNKESDTVIWGVQKFFSLLEKGAPNTVELLFVPENHILEISEKGRLVIENRDLFVSRRLTDQIRGFAGGEWRKAQLLHKKKETGEVSRSTRVVGAKRKESYEKYGYCVKNAYHAIRLLEEGIELLKFGVITFPRPNADELKILRNGKLSFEQVKAKIESLMEEFALAEESSLLRDNPDKEAIDDLYLNVIKESIFKYFGLGDNYDSCNSSSLYRD